VSVPGTLRGARIAAMVNVAKLQSLMLLIAGNPDVKKLGLTKLWKLIYFCDVRALREEGASITGSEFIKYPHGPVPSRGDKSLKLLLRQGRIATEQKAVGGYMQTSITVLDAPDLSLFTKVEREIVAKVCHDLGGLSAKKLSDISHEEPAWALAHELDKLDKELMHYGRAEDPEDL